MSCVMHHIYGCSDEPHAKVECLREARRRKLALSLANLPEAMQHLAQLYAVSELLQVALA